MTRAISIHIGLNALDADRYRRWEGKLCGAENDARAMLKLAGAQGFAARSLLGAAATRDAVVAALADAAEALAAGDLLLVTFSGHGASLPDRDGDEKEDADDTDGRDEGDGGTDPDEKDEKDEVWCLYDGVLFDDEINHQLCRLAAGVRVLVVSDSCFSGSVTRHDVGGRVAAPTKTRSAARDGRAAAISRQAPDATVRAVLRDGAAEYATRKDAVAGSRGKVPGADVLLLAACEERQTACDGPHHGLFTEALLAVWNRGAFAGGHRAFLSEIRARVVAANPHQTPVLYRVRRVALAFLEAPPFTP